MTEPTAYGLRSRLSALGGASRPTRVAACESLRMPRAPYCLGTGLKYDSSFFHRTLRRTLIPHSWGPLPRYRSDLKGIAISTVQPSSSRRLRDTQIVFQSRLASRSSVICESHMPPMEFT